MDPLASLFQHLDHWRHLPSYQLERRIDIFFAIYLRGLVEDFTGVALDEVMLPEFPIKRDLIWPEQPTEQSVKVDYALFTPDRRRVFFVELKTDGASRRTEQDFYLQAAQQLGFRRIVEGLRAILLKTDSPRKYHHLATALARLGYLTLPPDLASYLYPAPRRGLSERLRSIEVTPLDARIEIIYIQPVATEGDTSIDFARCAAYIDRFPDPLSKAFAEHLRRWTTPAGSTPPG